MEEALDNQHCSQFTSFGLQPTSSWRWVSKSQFSFILAYVGWPGKLKHISCFLLPRDLTVTLSWCMALQSHLFSPRNLKCSSCNKNLNILIMGRVPTPRIGQLRVIVTRGGSLTISALWLLSIITKDPIGKGTPCVSVCAFVIAW